jgi:hypothetical protein
MSLRKIKVLFRNKLAPPSRSPPERFWRLLPLTLLAPSDLFPSPAVVVVADGGTHPVEDCRREVFNGGVSREEVRR